MSDVFAIGALLFVLYIVFNLARYSREAEKNDVVIYRVDYPGRYVEVGREKKTDAKTIRQPEKINKIEIVEVGRWWND